jgi:hypothetical protein
MLVTDGLGLEGYLGRLMAAVENPRLTVIDTGLRRLHSDIARQLRPYAGRTFVTLHDVAPSAPAFWEEANLRLRANGLATAKLTKSPTKPIPVHPSLGQELCVLCSAQLGSARPRRALVALHDDRGHHRSGDEEGGGMA